MTNRTSSTNDDAASESGSDLSEIRDARVVAASPSPSRSPSPASQYGNDDGEFTQQSEEDNNNVSEDADFDMDESMEDGNNTTARAERSTSQESRRATKRKKGIEDDEYIKANPELYGLRRSVRNILCVSNCLFDNQYRADLFNIVQS